MMAVLSLLVLAPVLYASRNGGVYTFAVYIAILVVSVGTISDVSRVCKSKSCKNIIVLGFFFRLLLLFWDIYASHIYTLIGSGGDSNKFYNLSKIVCEGGSVVFEKNFITVIGTIMKIVGESKLFMQFLFLLCSVWTIVAIYKVMVDLEFPETVCSYSMRFLCFLPNYAILSVIFLRESVMIMLISIGCCEFIRWLNTNRVHQLVRSIFISSFAAILHSGCIAVPISIVLAAILYNKRRNRFVIKLGSIFLIAIAFVVIVAMMNSNFGGLFNRFENVHSITDIGSTYSEGGSSYAKYVGDSSSIPRIVIFTIPRIAFFLFSPMIWQIRGINDIVSIIFSAAFYFYVFIRSYKTIVAKNYYENSKKMLIGLFIICFGMIFVFAWGTTNSGTALRHRDKIVGLCVLMLAICRRESEIMHYRI